MAKQKGIFKFTGTLQHITGYEMNGQFYVKTKSEISRRKMRNDPCFANTRRAQQYFTRAQKLAKEVYHYHMHADDRHLKNWYRLRNRAQELLRTDLGYDATMRILLQEFVTHPNSKAPTRRSPAREQLPGTKLPAASATLELGRAFGRMDPSTSLLEQLAGINQLMQRLLDNGRHSGLQQPKKFRETLRCRRE